MFACPKSSCFLFTIYRWRPFPGFSAFFKVSQIMILRPTLLISASPQSYSSVLHHQSRPYDVKEV
ncbi:60S ribosomal protein L8 [Schizosaccharomyces japonicus yFS275]|uniref:60S ribosomal protein L8 n=1 Tax=Schizosaccharomyces japonicus (strain yFS275 / FY16936) TaxID=402676 RepID=B6JYQ8_SCHJY|nr:60S ribosomal protein L8 [Schizosaccharomyces japonicus yFS275]EEB06676.1 60S ribosomal protein L8 [Schizosaccharomyces japonicus yFS275]